MILEHVSCDLCGSEKYRIRYKKPDNWLRKNIFQFPVVECLDCGLVYVNPRPTMESMADFYPPDYHQDRDGVSFIRRYELQRRYLPSLSGKKVLDIGCARGDFLSYLLKNESNLEAFGVDAFSAEVCDHRIQFLPGLFTNNNYDANYFDLITAWAVFEHLHQPLEYFREASRVLKPGGEMIILVTNAESLYGRFAYMEDIPRHTFHYSKKTLKQYGEKVGLSLDKIMFCDDIFDGCGRGTVSFSLAKLFGFTWEKHMLGKVNLPAKAAQTLGSYIDRIIFSTHWEGKLEMSGIMVAHYVKP